MIKSISIAGYKSIKTLDALELRPLNILIGERHFPQEGRQ